MLSRASEDTDQLPPKEVPLPVGAWVRWPLCRFLLRHCCLSPCPRGQGQEANEIVYCCPDGDDYIPSREPPGSETEGGEGRLVALGWRRSRPNSSRFQMERLDTRQTLAYVGLRPWRQRAPAICTTVDSFRKGDALCQVRDLPPLLAVTLLVIILPLLFIAHRPRAVCCWSRCFAGRSSGPGVGTGRCTFILVHFSLEKTEARPRAREPTAKGL